MADARLQRQIEEFQDYVIILSEEVTSWLNITISRHSKQNHTLYFRKLKRATNVNMYSIT